MVVETSVEIKLGETGYDCYTFCRKIVICRSTANFSVNLESQFFRSKLGS